MYSKAKKNFLWMETLAYTAYKPIGQGNAPSCGNVQIPVNACAGCHNGFTYKSVNPSISGSDKGGVPSTISYIKFLFLAAILWGTLVELLETQSIASWWCEEFDPASQLDLCN